MLYGAAVIWGLGAGAVYGTCVGNALKWFPDRRGLAAGLTAAGFGAGAAVTVVPIRLCNRHYGYQSTFLWFGLVQGVVILILARLLFAPRSHTVPKRVHRALTARDFTFHGEMLHTPLFWLLYRDVRTGSLRRPDRQRRSCRPSPRITASPKDLTICSASPDRAHAGAVVDNVLNGLARPFFGWVSDRIGREVTMGLVFTWAAASYLEPGRLRL